MLFKLTYVVKSLHFNDGDKFYFKYEVEGKIIKVELRMLELKEIKPHYRQGDIFCIATCENVIPHIEVINNKSFDEDKLQAIKPILDETHLLLDKYSKNTIHNFRWVRGGAEPYKPIRFVESFLWSQNGTQWEHVPGQKISFGISFGFPIEKEISKEKIEVVQKLTSGGIVEPLSYELLCEAWNNRLLTPRSALIIGIAAAEIGFKEYVVKLLPETEWLLLNMQSPSLIKMLTNFLPTTPAICKINDRVLPPPKKIIKTLQEGIELRNKIVHSKFEQLNSDVVSEILGAVYDLLYLLDFYSGHKWATDRISVETIKALIEKSKSN